MTRRRSKRRLRDKKIAGAGLDVWEKEPPPAEHPLMKYDNVIVTPHMAGVTAEARVKMGQIAAEQILDALDGKPVARIINPQVWPDYAKRFEKAFGFSPCRRRPSRTGTRGEARVGAVIPGRGR